MRTSPRTLPISGCGTARNGWMSARCKARPVQLVLTVLTVLTALAVFLALEVLPALQVPPVPKVFRGWTVRSPAQQVLSAQLALLAPRVLTVLTR